MLPLCGATGGGGASLHEGEPSQWWWGYFKWGGGGAVTWQPIAWSGSHDICEHVGGIFQNCHTESLFRASVFIVIYTPSLSKAPHSL